MKRVYAKEEYCIGCRLCEIYCILSHSEYKNDLIKAFKKSLQRPPARIQVEEEGALSFALQCRHCDEAYCVKSCITGAMQKDPETGVVFNEKERCVGCWTCIAACPYGAIIKDETSKKIASKCDLCGQNETPYCVQNCPNGALIFSEEPPYKTSVKGGE
ncbi:MAG: anaerobic carbon-monoxide dehydrogenase iron sulfur subunit [Clostridia bacterium]|jgi:carbon-monoxide dehydrogenase iron sulfur subunit|nr:4Fe-4S ferredoxin iron-sulfur binding domain protein [Clostridiales bacterium]MDK2986176.1 anaerobic carbon-monoxide dehydrogenase iron sulfur subunit [Clostridia bacterium]